MKKRYITLCAAVLIIAALCFWQQNNIKALFIFATNDSEQTEKLIQENKNKVSEVIEKYPDASVRELTEDEEEKIANGEMSISEAVDMLISEANEKSDSVNPSSGESTKPQGSQTTANAGSDSETKPSSASSTKSTESAVIQRYTAELYSMKAYYIGQLNQIEGKARAEYSSMSTAEKKNLSKAAFVGKYASYATSLMGECDGKVNSLLSSMKAELKAVGGDLSIISTIKQAYEGEKAARKAYYLNMIS